MPFSGFPEDALRFLADLAQHNERAWFEAHQEAYERFILEPAKALVEALGGRLRELDPKLHAIPRLRGSIKSMERRARFPRSTAPLFKPHVDLWFWSGPRRAWDNSGFFLRLGAERLSLATGMIEFQKPALARYREHLLAGSRGAELLDIVRRLRDDGFVVMGEGYKKTPPGIPKDHPCAELSKHRGLFAVMECAHPVELRTEAFVELCYERFARMAPLHTWLVGLRS